MENRLKGMLIHESGLSYNSFRIEFIPFFISIRNEMSIWNHVNLNRDESSVQSLMQTRIEFEVSFVIETTVETQSVLM